MNMKNRTTLLAALAWAVVLVANPVHAVELVPGTPLSISLGASGPPTAVPNPASVKNDIFIDVPPDATTLRLTLKADNIANDIDLLVTFGKPLDVSIPVNDLFGTADYISAGADGDEYVAIIKSQNLPALQQGRWFITALNFINTPVNATVTASIQTGPLDPLVIDVVFDDPTDFGGDPMNPTPCGIDEWTDSTPFSPIGSNNATTLGEARRNAFLRATELLGATLTSPVPIRIQACWDQLDFGVLAQAGPRTAFARTPGAADPDALIPAVLVRRLAGTDLCRVGGGDCDAPDIIATFTTAAKWEYGLNPAPVNTGDPDFVAVAMHEITHGLGFVSFVDTMTGAKPMLTDGSIVNDLYSDNVVYFNNGDPLRFSDITDAQRFTAMKSITQLQWDGSNAVASPRNIFSGNFMGYPWLHAPVIIEPGSTLSHLHTDFPGDDLMGPVATGKPRTPGISTAFLKDAGWGDAPATVAVPDPTRGLYWDRSKNGHGFDLQRSGSNWFLLMYSYRDDNTPLWYLATGTVTNGVFSGDASQFDYDANRMEKAQAIPGTGGPVTIDFSQSSVANAAACNDGTNRGTATLLGAFDFDLDGTAGQWCVEPFQFGTGPVVPDFTGSWFNSTDSGWGMTIYTRLSQTAGLSDLIVVLYYYDADGMPRWALGVLLGADLSQEVTVDMSQFTGFCPTCAPVTPGDAPAGTVRLLLSAPSTTAGSGNTANINVDFLGAPGGQWIRADTDIQELSDLPD